MDNINLKTQIDKNKKSLYRISKDTGIPYTNLNELANGKTDINRSNSETVCRLARYFGCQMEDLLNPIEQKTQSGNRYRKLNTPFNVPEDIDKAIDDLLRALNTDDFSADCYMSELNSLLNGCDMDMDEEDVSVLRQYYCRGGIYDRAD